MGESPAEALSCDLEQGRLRLTDTLYAGEHWQMALLYGGGTFGLAIPFFNAIIPPSAEGRPSDQDEHHIP